LEGFTLVIPDEFKDFKNKLREYYNEISQSFEDGDPKLEDFTEQFLKVIQFFKKNCSSASSAKCFYFQKKTNDANEEILFAYYPDPSDEEIFVLIFTDFQLQDVFPETGKSISKSRNFIGKGKLFLKSKISKRKGK